MSRKSLRLVAAVILCIALLAAMVGCGQSAQQPAATTQAVSSQAASTQAPAEAPKEIVTIKTIYPGDEPAGTKTVLAAVNDKMGKDIGVNLELTWAPWDQYGNKVQMAVAAGEEIDWHWGGSSDASGDLAKKIIAPLDDLLAKYGKPIYDNIPVERFKYLNIGGIQYGVPFAGNAPTVNTFHSALYREDLRVKYNLPALDSIENIELFMKTIKEKEPTMSPLVSTSFAYSIELAFGPEEFLGGTNGACAIKINSDNSATVVPIQNAESFKGSVQKMRDWYNAGYLPKDVLNIGDVQSKLNSGAAAMINGSAMSASEQQGVIAANVPGAVLQDAPIHGTFRQKYLAGDGGNAFYLSPTSKHPDQVVQFWAWVLTSQENYDLYCYGINGTNYSLESNGKIKFLNSDYTSFPSWMFKNLNFLRFNSVLSDEYINTLKQWDNGGVAYPLDGFTFDPKTVTTELSQCGSVWGSYSAGLNSGAVDLVKTLPEFEKKMKAAGQEKVVVEAQKQVDAFLAK